MSGSPAIAAPTDFIGVNAHQPAADVLDGMKSLGASWVRIDFNWFQAAPAKGKYTWTLFDTLINNALARGLQVFPTIGYGPKWASEADTDGKPNNEAPKAGEYQKFCQAAAARYKGKITHWGLWNEPNLGFFDGSQQQWIDRIVIEGVKGIKAGCPTCKVLGPELASVGSDYDKWLDASLKALKKAGLMFDIVTWHIYSSFLELESLWACTKDLFVHDLDSHRVCKVAGITVYEGPLSVREVLLANGLPNLPVWITEVGRTAPVADAQKTKEQVTYYRRTIEEQLKRSWWTHTFFYEIVDDNKINDKWGMAVRTGSNPTFPGSYQLKPVWSFIKNVLAKNPALGGTGTACNDSLDNDGDKLIDYPKDPGCSSASDPTETSGTMKPDAGPPDASLAKADTGAKPGDGPTADASAANEGPASNKDAVTADAPGTTPDSSGAQPGESSGCAVSGHVSSRGSPLLLLALIYALWLRRRSRLQP